MPKKPAPRPEDQESHLKKFREELGINQEDLAREFGVSSPTISRWELGKAAKAAFVCVATPLRV